MSNFELRFDSYQRTCGIIVWNIGGGHFHSHMFSLHRNPLYPRHFGNNSLWREMEERQWPR